MFLLCIETKDAPLYFLCKTRGAAHKKVSEGLMVTRRSSAAVIAKWYLWRVGQGPLATEITSRTCGACEARMGAKEGSPRAKRCGG